MSKKVGFFIALIEMQQYARLLHFVYHFVRDGDACLRITTSLGPGVTIVTNGLMRSADDITSTLKASALPPMQVNQIFSSGGRLDLLSDAEAGGYNSSTKGWGLCIARTICQGL